MKARLETKKVFLIASSDEEKQELLEKQILRQVSRPTIYKASDGAVALTKAESVPPHIVLTDLNLPKLNGTQLIERLFATKNFQNGAVLITDTIPEKEQYIDELVVGRIQFLTDLKDEKEFSRCLTRALNYAASNEDVDFQLRFLTPGDVLLREGEPAEHVYFVKKGQLHAYRSIDGKPVELGKIEDGEFVGEMAYINGEPRSANVAALAPTELIEVPLGVFDRVLYKRPSWSKALVLTLSKRLKAANATKSVHEK